MTNEQIAREIMNKMDEWIARERKENRFPANGLEGQYFLEKLTCDALNEAEERGRQEELKRVERMNNSTQTVNSDDLETAHRAGKFSAWQDIYMFYKADPSQSFIINWALGKMESHRKFYKAYNKTLITMDESEE